MAARNVSSFVITDGFMVSETGQLIYVRDDFVRRWVGCCILLYIPTITWSSSTNASLRESIAEQTFAAEKKRQN